MPIHRIAAFADGSSGGNPAGVWLGETLPPAADMQRIAAEVGFSETAFAVPEADAWRVRYFSPRCEVPFCGHATIALGAGLALAHGNQTYRLQLNDAAITVDGHASGSTLSAALQSPPTCSAPADPATITAVLYLFGYRADQLDPALPPLRMHAGADHFMFALQSRAVLAAMAYDFDRGQKFMDAAGVVTIAFVTAETPRRFHVRNAFATGGVVEDPATGAAAAAFAGALRDIGWPHGGAIEIIQGEDMGQRSRISATFSNVPGSSIRVAGTARIMDYPS
jgi:PhzF family phenazine biosynthesis protein